MREVKVKTLPPGKFAQTVSVGALSLLADEEVTDGGTDLGPAPFEWLLSSLGACTSMTLKMYADRKGWPLESCEVTLTGVNAPNGLSIMRTVQLTGALSEEQRTALLGIANKCPVHKALSNPITITTTSLSP